MKIRWTEGKECHLYIVSFCVFACANLMYAAPHVTCPRSALYANRLYLSLYRKYNADRLSGAGEGQPRIVGEPITQQRYSAGTDAPSVCVPFPQVTFRCTPVHRCTLQLSLAPMCTSAAVL